jgi:hypothetical protein
MRPHILHSSDITVTDMFCGAGGSSYGASRVPGVRIYRAMNHWKRAIETHGANFPDTEHVLADIQEVSPQYFDRSDILIASPSCFPVGTMILTQKGIIPIEEIQIGDRVLTHKNRWRAVTRIMSRESSTLILQGHGHNRLEVTTEHPFYARQQRFAWNNEKRDYDRRIYDPPSWVQAQDLLNQKYRWSTPTQYEELPVPTLPNNEELLTNSEFWWMVGRWLGDGMLRQRDKVAGEITIVCGKHEADELEKRLAYWLPTDANKRIRRGELRWRRGEERTTSTFTCSSQTLTRWISTHFGRYSHGKTLPAWALSLPQDHRQALLDGYLASDGSQGTRRTQADTISKRLAVGIRLLAESLGYRVSLGIYPQHSTNIEGRSVTGQNIWHLAWENNKSQREAFEDDSHSWGLVKQIHPGQSQVVVYNFSVEEDESYTADGIVVHNCTNHSLAKGRKKQQTSPQLELPWDGDEFGPPLPLSAEERSRCTMWDPLKWARIHKYNYVILENVVDVRGWTYYQMWLDAWRTLDDVGYDVQVVYWNSQFFHPTP